MAAPGGHHHHTDLARIALSLRAEDLIFRKDSGHAAAEEPRPKFLKHPGAPAKLKRPHRACKTDLDEPKERKPEKKPQKPVEIASAGTPARPCGETRFLCTRRSHVAP